MRSITFLVFAAPLLLAGCAGAPRKPDKPTEVKSVPVIRSASDDVFARLESSTASGQGGVRPTALLASPVDAAVVERLVRQRLGDATVRAVRDLLGSAAKAQELELPLRDLSGVLRTVLAEGGDAETRSQVLVAALVRNGLTAGVKQLVKDGIVDAGTCEAANQMAAIYEGLSASVFLRGLGFVESKGMVPSTCAAFAAEIATFADTIGSLGTEVTRLEGIGKAFTSAKSACDPKKVNLSVDLDLAVSRAANGNEKSELQQVWDLRSAWRRGRPTTVPVSAEQRTCYVALEDLAQSLDAGFEALAARSRGVALTLDRAKATVELVRQRVVVALAASDRVLSRAASRISGAAPEGLQGSPPDPVLAKLLEDLKKEQVKVGVDISSQTPSAFLNSLDSLNLRVKDCAAGKNLPDCKTISAVETYLQVAAKFAGIARAAAEREELAKLGLPQILAAMEAASLDLPELARFQPIVAALATGQPIRRDDALRVVTWLKDVANANAKLKPELRDLLSAFFDAVPAAVREDRAVAVGLRVDGSALATGTLTNWVDRQAGGWYLRATVGTGYLRAHKGPGKGIAPVVQEELGVGYRWTAGPNVLIGPHLAASGLLFKAVPTDVAKDSIFVALGASCNVYRMIEASLGVGPLWREDPSGKRSRTAAVSLSLQIPLGDYFRAMADRPAASESTAGTH